MNFRNTSPDDLDVNITPLIDVVFLLLIFFMVSTTFDHQSELSIDLPEASGEIVSSEKKVLNISIDAKGEFYLNDKKLKSNNTQTLLSEIKQQAENIKDPKIIISADKNTPHQAVMSVMDIARQLGINHLTFAAIKPDE